MLSVSRYLDKAVVSRGNTRALAPILLSPSRTSLSQPLLQRLTQLPLLRQDCTITQASASSSSAPLGSDSHKGHAFLHDFCMSIPYGAISIIAGVILCVLGATTLGGTAAIAGATIVAASVLSLKEWKAGQSSTFYTLTSAAASAGVAYMAYSGAPALKGVAVLCANALLLLSGALAAFCVYNVLAGGNPPPKPKSA